MKKLLLIGAVLAVGLVHAATFELIPTDCSFPRAKQIINQNYTNNTILVTNLTVYTAKGYIANAVVTNGAGEAMLFVTNVTVKL